MSKMHISGYLQGAAVGISVTAHAQGAAAP